MNPVSLSAAVQTMSWKDHDNCVHVFVCGDMDSKVQRMMHSYSLEESAAVERIKETDKQRRNITATIPEVTGRLHPTMICA